MKSHRLQKKNGTMKFAYWIILHPNFQQPNAYEGVALGKGGAWSWEKEGRSLGKRRGVVFGNVVFRRLILWSLSATAFVHKTTPLHSQDHTLTHSEVFLLLQTTPLHSQDHTLTIHSHSEVCFFLQARNSPTRQKRVATAAKVATIMIPITRGSRWLPATGTMAIESVHL